MPRLHPKLIAAAARTDHARRTAEFQRALIGRLDCSGAPSADARMMLRIYQSFLGHLEQHTNGTSEQGAGRAWSKSLGRVSLLNSRPHHKRTVGFMCIPELLGLGRIKPRLYFSMPWACHLPLNLRSDD